MQKSTEFPEAVKITALRSQPRFVRYCTMPRNHYRLVVTNSYRRGKSPLPTDRVSAIIGSHEWMGAKKQKVARVESNNNASSDERFPGVFQQTALYRRGTRRWIHVAQMPLEDEVPDEGLGDQILIQYALQSMRDGGSVHAG